MGGRDGEKISGELMCNDSTSCQKMPTSQGEKLLLPEMFLCSIQVTHGFHRAHKDTRDLVTGPILTTSMLCRKEGKSGCSVRCGEEESECVTVKL